MNIDIKHYNQKCKEHEENRVPMAERDAYWKRYLLTGRSVDSVPINWAPNT